MKIDIPIEDCHRSKGNAGKLAPGPMAIKRSTDAQRKVFIVQFAPQRENSSSIRRAGICAVAVSLVSFSRNRLIQFVKIGG